ncbi:MAG: YkvA family protein [Thermoleophilaceae bacterium]
MTPAATTSWEWAALAVASLAVIYGGLVAGLALAGRPGSARALARFIPDALVLFRRLLADERVPRRRKVALALGVAYLAMPIDLVPDLIPVVGQIDDALVVAILLRYLLRGGGPALLEELWPGPDESLRALMRLAFGPPAAR